MPGFAAKYSAGRIESRSSGVRQGRSDSRAVRCVVGRTTVAVSSPPMPARFSRNVSGSDGTLLPAVCEQTGHYNMAAALASRASCLIDTAGSVQGMPNRSAAWLGTDQPLEPVSSASVKFVSAIDRREGPCSSLVCDVDSSSAPVLTVSCAASVLSRVGRNLDRESGQSWGMSAWIRQSEKFGDSQ